MSAFFYCVKEGGARGIRGAPATVSFTAKMNTPGLAGYGGTTRAYRHTSQCRGLAEISLQLKYTDTSTCGGW